MSDSFPYLTIAKRFGVPYQSVVVVAQMHENYRLRHPGEIWDSDIKDVSIQIQGAIYAAYAAERRRRQLVSSNEIDSGYDCLKTDLR